MGVLSPASVPVGLAFLCSLYTGRYCSTGQSDDWVTVRTPATPQLEAAQPGPGSLSRCRAGKEPRLVLCARRRRAKAGSCSKSS